MQPARRWKLQMRTTRDSDSNLRMASSNNSDRMTLTPRVSTSSAAFSKLFSSSTMSPNEGNQPKSLLAKVRFLLLLPLRLLLKPFIHLVRIGVDELDEDATITITEEEAIQPLQTTSLGSTAAIETSGVSVETAQQDPTVASSTTKLSQPVSSTPNAKTALLDPNSGISDLQVESSAETTASKIQIEDGESMQEIPSASTSPTGDRWAVAAPHIDLSGSWELIMTDKFKDEYDKYLEGLGQPFLVRSVALGIVALTTEKLSQSDDGRSLLIRGKNVRGVWDRTLVSSGTVVGRDEYSPLLVPIMTADSEQVDAESWWEDDGKVHVSWLRGVKKYGGGSFASRRYLEDDDTVYVCESIFHKDGSNKPPPTITWKFRRQEKAATEET